MEFKSLLESASTNSQRRYKCMYCTKSYERAKLVNHIDKVHEDMIPEGYAASRLVFNMINKKDHGTCTICGKESPWNEEKGRYDRICTNPECKKKYIKMTEERLQKARGITKQQMLNDPEFQEKMLANRGISGKYKFQDGTYKTYTGTYEKKFLEFLDVFLHVDPADIYAPGPVIEYEYEGEKHKWITDFYYEPYNLVFDIKDGGENPNNRSMVHYRAKQIEKEKAIKKLNKYNYIRLTDNNFEQLVLLMMELKELYLDSNKDMNHIIRINESSVSIGETKEYDSYHDKLYLVEYNVDRDAALKRCGVQDFPYVIQEAKEGNKHPLFIVLSYTYTTFGKLTKAITHADYSHAAISFDPSLHEMFSFNGDNKVNNNGGFSIEDINEYTRFSDKSYMLINVVFVNDSQYESVKNYVDEYKKNIKNTKYSFANIFRILLNKPINDEGSNQMVCSEFVYSIFKYINQDFLNKSTNLVTPQDLADVKNKKIYKIYEGLITKYKEKNIEKKLVSLYNKAKVLGEQFLFEEYINEMSSKERNGLPDSVFGIPSKRKYPLDTEAHVRSAIKFFNYCDKKDEKELAENIIRAMKKFNITGIKVSDKNRFSKYCNSINEAYIKNEPDIYYNKDKFDSGKINLCFITGLSGSGKSTMGHKIEKDNVDCIELDDLLLVKDHFSMDNLKEYSDLMYSFFNGKGKKWYMGFNDVKKLSEKDPYEDQIFIDFINYAIAYSKSHKNKKYILEGVWVYKYMKPEQLKDFAVYVKGTSMLISKIRAAKRDSRDGETKFERAKAFTKGIFRNLKFYFIDEKQVQKFREYYSKLISSSSVKEDNAATTAMVGTATPIYSNNLRHACFSNSDDKKYAICKQYMTDLVLLDDDEVEPLEDFMEYATNIKMYEIEDPKVINESSINGYTEVYPYSNTLTDIRESVEATLLNGYNQLGIDSVPIFSLNENMECTNVRYYRDLNGVFIKNINTGFRSKSFESEEEISESLIEYISKSTI